MKGMSILRNLTRLLWFGIILGIIFLFKNVNTQKAEDFIIDREKPLDNQIRHFTSSRPIKLQSDLKYSEKPLWPLQWFMTEEIFTIDKCRYSPSMKIAEMHNKGVKGDGIGVVIIGNFPVNCLHEALQGRCHAQDLPTSLSMFPKKSLVGSWRKKYKIETSSPISSEIAGIIGMRDNGNTGGVGIAPHCHIGSVAIQPSSSHGSPEYCATKIIARNSSPSAEIFVHTWALPYLDDKRDILHAIDLSLLNFRDSKTVLKPHIVATGTSGILANTCQCNEYANADSAFVFGFVQHDGYLNPSSETCASLFGVVYSSSFGKKLYENLVTIDSVSPTSFYCANRSSKDSFATDQPGVGVAGGIMTLIIDCFKRKFGESPSISDLAFLLAFSSSSEDLQDKNMLWFSNGLGLMYSQQAGFGHPHMLNVESLLDTWIPTDFPVIYEVDRSTKDIDFKCENNSRRRTLTYVSNLICRFQFYNSQSRLHIQLVTVQLTAKLVNRGALSVYLISPAGTVSCILEGRPYDTDKEKYNKLLLRSNHFIGEQLEGEWSIRFYTYQENSKPLHSEDYLQTEGEVQPVDSKKPPPVGDDVSNLASESSNSNSHPNPSDEDTNSAGDQARNGKAAVSEEKSRKVGKKVGFQTDAPSGQNVVDSPPRGDVASMQQSTQPAESRSILRQSPTSAPSKNDINGTPSSDHLETGSNVVPLIMQPFPSPKSPAQGNSSRHLLERMFRIKKRQPNEVDLSQIKFRFVLHERLPSTFNLKPHVKPVAEREKNFELLKAWVDFRHYLFAKLDPQKQEVVTHPGGLSLVAIFNKHVKKLIMVQKNTNIDSVFSMTPDRLNAILGITDPQPAQSADQV